MDNNETHLVWVSSNLKYNIFNIHVYDFWIFLATVRSKVSRFTATRVPALLNGTVFLQSIKSNLEYRLAVPIFFSFKSHSAWSVTYLNIINQAVTHSVLFSIDLWMGLSEYQLPQDEVSSLKVVEQTNVVAR